MCVSYCSICQELEISVPILAESALNAPPISAEVVDVKDSEDSWVSVTPQLTSCSTA